MPFFMQDDLNLMIDTDREFRQRSGLADRFNLGSIGAAESGFTAPRRAASTSWSSEPRWWMRKVSWAAMPRSN